ncbi:MAG: hypothetical protein HY841_12495 [Bacteroidetes bacterium]|nr:hypothetical protein [Bacteroidota bacterium]
MKFFYTKYFLLFFSFFSLAEISFGQNIAINQNGNPAADCAVLDINTTGGTLGLLIPRVSLTNTSTQTISGTAVDGVIVYNTNSAIAGTGAAGTGYYYWSTVATAHWVNLVDNYAPGSAWMLSGNGNTTAGTDFLGTTDGVDFVIKTNGTERMRITSGGLTGFGTTNPITTTANYLLTIKTSATIQNGIDMTLSGGSGKGINISSASASYDGILVTNSTASNGLNGIGAVLSNTNIVSGYSAYRTGGGYSYGLYGINGTNAAYATNANTWAAFLQGRTVISSESSPTSPIGTDLEVRNTTTGAAAPATVSLRQTTSLTTTGNVLTNLNFGDNYQNSPQAQIQVIRGAFSSGSTDLPTDMLFYTTPDASAAMAERMRIINSGQVGINMTPTMQLDVTSASATASDAAIRGISTGTGVTLYGVKGSVAATGSLSSGVFGIASGTGQVYGVLGQIPNSTTTNSAGVRGFVAQTTGATYGVMGEDASSDGNSAGVLGQATSTTGAVNGVWGTTPSTSNGATGVYGTATGASGSTYGVLGQTSSTSSGAYGVYGIATATSNVAAGYNSGQTYSGVYGSSSTNGQGSTKDMWHFAVHGSYCDCDAVFFGNRSGGVLGGIKNSAGTLQQWGSLGYQASTNTRYSGYFSAAILNGGAGRYNSTSNLNDEKTGIGIGSYGGLMGGWIRGDVYGMNIKGERYSLYVDGKQYTNDVITQVSNNGTAERNVSYVSTSTSVDVYARGSGKLENGRATISFDRNYSTQLSVDEKVMLTITPVGPSNGVYASEISPKGFTVIENNNGTSNVEFSWIAVGVRKGYEKVEHPKEILSSGYDEKMKGVMFNENDLKNSGTPIWWDGAQLRFDPMSKQENTTEKSDRTIDDPKFGNEMTPTPANATPEKQNPK